MSKIRVMIILHAYQPPYPIQEKWVLDRIVENCYRPFFSNLHKYPLVKIILNINASLIRMLLEDATDVIDLIRDGAERDQIEFLQTAAFHPIIPLISENEVQFQIYKNNEINQKYLGSSFLPRGFFPPELAVDEKSARLLSRQGLSFIIAPTNCIPDDMVNIVPYLSEGGTKLSIITRDKGLSNSVSFTKYGRDVESAIRDFSEKNNPNGKPIVLAMDLETFGEHHEHYWQFLFNFLADQNIQTLHSTEFLELSRQTEISTISPSSWSTDNQELQNGVNFPLWDHPLNPIHTIQHAHFKLIQSQLDDGAYDLTKFTEATQELILASMHSCQYWWASGAGRWSPEMITKGFKIQQLALEKILEERNRNEGSILDLSNLLYERLTRALTLRSK